MKNALARSLVAGLAVTAGLAVGDAIPAFAHEGRATGAFQVAVGWGEEPAYTGFKNSVQVTLSEANGGPPVTDLGDSLKVEVSKGSDTITLPLEANFRVGASGTPGDYRAWLTPTRPGTYTFRVVGTVRGQSVDESFTSSSTTFNDVEDVANIQFPAKDPSPGQLATRIEREIPRAVEAGLRQADDQVNSARTLAVVAMVVGALALVTAAAALVSGRRSRRGDGPDGGGSQAAEEQAGSLSR